MIMWSVGATPDWKKGALPNLGGALALTEQVFEPTDPQFRFRAELPSPPVAGTPALPPSESHGPPLDLVLAAWDVRPPAPVTPLPSVTPMTTGLWLTKDYSIAVGEDAYFRLPTNGDSVAFHTVNNITITNSGTITMIGLNGPNNHLSMSLVGGEAATASQDPGFHNTATGIVRVLGDNRPVAVASVRNFVNDGVVQVVSTGTFGGMYACIGSTYAQDALFRNNGSITVWSESQAYGVSFLNGGRFENSGTFTLVAPQAESIVRYFGFESTFVNSGHLEIIDGDDDRTSSVVDYKVWGNVTFVNTGTMIGDYAIRFRPDGGSDSAGNDTVQNSGHIIGHIDLAMGNDTVVNSGDIQGLVILASGNDRYDGANGILRGAVLAGDNDDTLIGGIGADNFFGEEGADVISGGAGDDYIDGGRGNDILDGGKGYDILSYASSHMGVTVDLAAGTTIAPSNRDTFQNFEDVLGSGFADTLLGDTGGNILEGGAGADTMDGRAGDDVLFGGRGDDVLTGGAGADVFLFSQGDGADRIRDFDPASDVIRIGGYDRAAQISDIAGGVLISMGSGGSLLIEGVTAAQLTPSNLTWSMTPYGGTSPIVDVWRPGETTIEVYLSGYTVAAGEVISFNDPYIGFYVGSAYGATTDQPYVYGDLKNYGTIQVTRTGEFNSVGVWGTSSNATFRNMEGGLLEVTAGGKATGVYVGFPSLAFHNAGRMVITGGTGAVGLDTWDYRVEATNTGEMVITAISGSAVGIRATNPVPINNSGTITVTAGGTGVANGIDLALVNDFARYPIVNSGTVIVRDSTTALDSAAVAVGRDGPSTSFLLNNTGWLEGDYSFRVSYPPYNSSPYDGEVVTNSATMIGLISTIGGNDQVLNTGTIAGDVLLGEGADLFDGRGGVQNGFIFGEAGDDRLFGGAGDDFLSGGLGTDALDGGAGVDTAVFSGARAAYTITSVDGVITVTGPDGTDTIKGVEFLRFADGFTDLTGTSVHGVVNGGAHKDRLSATSAGDTLNGLGGDDILTSGSGNDTLNGGAGTDMVVFTGNRAAYTFNVSGGVTTVTGADGVDTVTGVEIFKFADGAYTASGDYYTDGRPIVGTMTEDQINGTPAGDIINGLGGDDIITGGLGNDAIDGGVGQDTVVFATSRTLNTLTFSGATITVTGPEGTDILTNVERLRFTEQFITYWVMVGTAGNDVINGTDSRDEIYAGAGDDTIYGNRGNDIIDGGDGIDTFVNAANLAENAFGVSGGRIFVQGGGLSYLTNVEFVQVAGGRLVHIGTLGADTLSGSAGQNWLEGFDGDDILTGRGGDDKLTGGAGIDTAVFSGLRSSYVINALADGSVQVFGADGMDVLMSIERFRFDDGLFDLSGQSLPMELNGTPGSDTVNGGAAADVIASGAGNDVISGGDGDDVIDDGTGRDRVDGGEGLDTLITSGLRADYRVLQTATGFLLKGPDGSTRMTNVELIKFGDGKVIDLRIQYGPDGWGAFVDGAGFGDEPLVRPAEPVTGSKGGDQPQVPPADDHFILPDGPLVLPALMDKTFDDDALVLPGADTPGGRFAFAADDAGLVVMGPHGPHLLDIDLIRADGAHDPWA